MYVFNKGLFHTLRAPLLLLLTPCPKRGTPAAIRPARRLPKGESVGHGRRKARGQGDLDVQRGRRTRLHGALPGRPEPGEDGEDGRDVFFLELGVAEVEKQ